MEKIVLGSKEYYLVPVSDWEEVEELLRFYLGGVPDIGPKKPSPETNVSSIEVDGVEARMAQPKISDYRERFKRHALTPQDVTASPTPVKLHQFGQDEFDKFSYDGEKLFFGEGLTYDYY